MSPLAHSAIINVASQAFSALIWCGTGYAVFVLGHSGWWFLLTAGVDGFFSVGLTRSKR